MDSGISACLDGLTRSEKGVHAGTFGLIGFSCSHALTPERHPVEIVTRHRGAGGHICAVNVEDSYTQIGTDGWNQAIQRPGIHRFEHSAYLDLQVRGYTSADKARLSPSLHHTSVTG